MDSWTERLEKAYAANGIPWDKRLSMLTDAQAKRLAQYWEWKASEPRTPVGDPGAGRAIRGQLLYEG